MTPQLARAARAKPWRLAAPLLWVLANVILATGLHLRQLDHPPSGRPSIVGGAAGWARASEVLRCPRPDLVSTPITRIVTAHTASGGVMDRLPPQHSAVGALRWALVIIFLLFGTAKFAAYEAEGVARIAERYWLFGWLYPLGGVRFASNVIGTLELATAALLAAGAWSRRAGLVGGLMGMATFLVTLSFILGIQPWEEGYGFPFMGSTMQFLVKDLVLLAACYALALDAAHGLRKAGGGRNSRG